MNAKLLVGMLMMVCLLAIPATSWWDENWANQTCFNYTHSGRVDEPIRINLSSICVEGVDCLENYSDVRVIQNDVSLTYQLVDIYYNATTPYYWLYFISPTSGEQVCIYWNNPSATPITNGSLFYFIDEMDGLGNFGYDPNPAYYEAWGGYMRMYLWTSYLHPETANTGWCRVGTPDTISSTHCREDVMTKEYFTAPFYYGYEMFYITHDGAGCPDTASNCGDAYISWGTNIEYDCYTTRHGLRWSANVNGLGISLFGNSTSTQIFSSIGSPNQKIWRAKVFVNDTTEAWVWNDTGLMGYGSVSDGLWGDTRQLQLAPKNDLAIFDLNYLYVSPTNFTTYSPQNTLFITEVVCEPDWYCTGYADECVECEQACDSVLDLNVCGEEYTGDYTEFEPQDCCEENEITGYVAQYSTSDVGKQVVDGLGTAGVELISLAGLLVFGCIIGFLIWVKKKNKG